MQEEVAVITAIKQTGCGTVNLALGPARSEHGSGGGPGLIVVKFKGTIVPCPVKKTVSSLTPRSMYIPEERKG